MIPAYNEARRLPATLRRWHEYLRDQTYPWEIVVVANGCTDDTEEVVLAASDAIPHLRLLRASKRGKGVATRRGVLASHGQVVFLSDADLSMPPDELARFLDVIAVADVVAGSREAPGARRYHEPWHRHMMGRIFNRLVQLLAVQGIEDTQCGFKALRRPAAQDLFARQTLGGFGFDVELLYLAQKFGYAVRELPIDWYFDADTRVRPGIDSLEMLGEVVLLRIRDALGRYNSPASSRAKGGDVA